MLLILQTFSNSVCLPHTNSLQAKYLGENWSLEVDIDRNSRVAERLACIRGIERFSERYRMPGVREYYSETLLNSSYTFRPRRTPPS